MALPRPPCNTNVYLQKAIFRNFSLSKNPIFGTAIVNSITKEPRQAFCPNFFYNHLIFMPDIVATSCMVVLYSLHSGCYSALGHKPTQILFLMEKCFSSRSCQSTVYCIRKHYQLVLICNRLVQISQTNRVNLVNP